MSGLSLRLEVRKLDTLCLFSVLNPASKARHLSIFHGRDEQLNAENVNVSSLHYIWQLFYSFFFFFFLGTIHLYGDSRGFVPLERDLARLLVLNINLSLCCITLLQFPREAPYHLPNNLHANECRAPSGELRFPAPLNLTRVIGASGQRMRKQSGNTPLCGWESDYKMSSDKIYLDLFILARRYALGTVGA